MRKWILFFDCQWNERKHKYKFNRSIILKNFFIIICIRNCNNNSSKSILYFSMWSEKRKGRKKKCRDRIDLEETIRLSRRNNDASHRINCNGIGFYILRIYQQWSIVLFPNELFTIFKSEMAFLFAHSQLSKRLIKIKIFRTIYSVFVCTTSIL